MAASKAPHVVETCLVKDVETTIDGLAADYELQAMSSHQVGSGFGAYVEALLVFRLLPSAQTTGKSNGNRPGHRGPGAFAKKDR
jgi:hypothetical protein